MSYFRTKWNAVLLLCCVALLKRSTDVKGFSIQSTIRTLPGSLPLSNTVLRAQNNDKERLSLQELIDDTIESNRKLVIVTGGVVSSLGKGLTAAALGALLEQREQTPPLAPTRLPGRPPRPSDGPRSDAAKGRYY